MGDDSEWMKLPTDEKVQHKVWKARLAGYEEAIKLFGTLDEKSKEFTNYAGLIKKFVTDSNAVAQEKAVEAVIVFVENAAIAPKTAGEVVAGVVAKCLSASKVKTKENGKEIIMLYIEAEKQDIVQEALIEGTANKNPKIVIGCIQTMTQALRDFGNKIMPIKPIVKLLPKLLEDRDKNVREETKQLVVEIYRWIGQAIKPQLSNLKPVQLTELEGEFEKMSGGKAQQCRFLRSQQDLRAKMEEKAAAAEAGEDVDEEEEEGEEVDPYDLLEPVNILAALPKDFYDKVEAKKWQERKEALDAVQKLCENPKIEPGDHAPLVKVLLKVIAKDTNVMLVTLGGKCLAGLATGLRKKFSPYAAQAISTILDKFKEKKVMVVTALRDASDACLQSITLDPLIEDVLAALENKNPSIRAETALFLGRAFSRLTLATLPKKQLKAFCTGLLKTVNDTVPEVREASFMALGTAMKVVSEKNITAFLTDVDSIKMQKIKDSCETAVLLNAKGEPRSGGAAKAAAAAPKKTEAAKPVARPGAPPPSSARPKTAPAKSGGPPKKSGGPPRPKSSGAKKGAPAEEKQENALSDDAFLEKATEFLGAELMGQLENSNWKERLAGMERFTQILKQTSRSDIPCQVCVRAVNKKPGLKDNNFQVLKLRVELVSLLATSARFSRTAAEFVLPDLVDKVGDVKNGAAVQLALSDIAEATSLDFVAGQVVNLAFSQKNPKNQSESLVWFNKALQEFGMKVQIKPHIKNIKTAFQATNPGVRTAAICLQTLLYMFMGQQLRMFMYLANLAQSARGVRTAAICLQTLLYMFMGQQLRMFMYLAHLAQSARGVRTAAICLQTLLYMFMGQQLRMFMYLAHLAQSARGVRTAAIGLLATLYMFMGQQLRMFFEDEKAALLQQIDAEFEKVKGQKPPAPTRGVKPSEDDGGGEEENGEGGEDGAEESLTDMVPRNDVGDRFTAEMVESMADKNWKVRGEALQKVISILGEAKFITANLGPLPEAIKARLGDANKNLVTTTIGICVTLATNMGPHCKHHIKTIAPALVSCLGDSKPALRAAAVGALNAWVDQVNLTPLVECEAFSDALKLENPNLRQELLGWLTERLPNHKPLPKDELRLCIPHVLTCLEDRNGEVRKKAQEALVPFMIHTGYDAFLKASSKLKPASKDQIMQILEKARDGLPAKKPKAKAAAAPAKAASRPASNDYDDYDQGPPAKKEKSPSAEPPETKAKAPGKTKGKPMAAPSKRKKVEEDTGPVVSITETKEKRFKDEKNMKTLKWNFTEPRGEFVEQLRVQMEKNFSKTMMDQMFHTDFKFHIKAIETLIGCLETLQSEQMGNLDLLLRWFTLRFFDTNPSMLNKALEYLQALFKLLIDNDYTLHEIEAISFLPYFVIKAGENKDNVRREVRAIFKLLYKVYPASKMFVFISEGVRSKNSKQRTECLEELGYLIETYGISICQPTPQIALKLIASQISERDNGVRNAALNSMVTAYQLLGDGIYKYIGTLREKEQSYLDERIKRTNKTKPAAPPPTAAAQKQERPKSSPQQPQRSHTQGQIQRGGSALPKSQSSNSVRKEFQLELDDEDGQVNYDMPQLINHSNLDDIFQPVVMPTIKARPPSPGPKFFSSADTANTVNFVISQVTNRDISVTIQALAQIDEVLKDVEKVTVMEEHVEQLLVAMSMQFKMAYSTHMSDTDTPTDDVIRLYRCLLCTLLALFQNSALALHATKDILKELINNLITMLLDNRLMEMEEGPQLVRSVNVIVVKIIEKSDQTNILCALIRLLQDCAGSETCSNKFLELNMKCLWKIVRMLPETINHLNLDRVLYDCHIFLKAFPTPTWKERSNDTPLRTIKTILHSIAKLKGSKILNHLGQIDAGEPSEVKAYLQKMLMKEKTHQGDSEMNGTDDNKTPRSVSKTKRLSKTTHDMLTEIFKKVGSKENTKEGLQDLYAFKKKYPDADLEPFLKKSSHFFQNYIERGLRAIEAEEGEKTQSDDGSETRTSQPLSERSIGSDYMIEKTSKLHNIKPDSNKNVQAVSTTDDTDAGYYFERLRALRAQCGLDSSGDKGDKKSDTVETTRVEEDRKSEEVKSSLESIETSVSPVPEAPKASATDVSQLKARLERIKKMANS